MPCNCRTPYPSSALHAENPLASISKQMPQQGLKPLPHRSLTEKLSKKESALAVVKSPPWTGCGTPPGGVRVLSNPLHALLYHVRPFRRPQVHCSLAGGALGRPPRGRQASSSHNQSSLVLVSDLSNQKLKIKKGDGDTV